MKPAEENNHDSFYKQLINFNFQLFLIKKIIMKTIQNLICLFTLTSLILFSSCVKEHSPNYNEKLLTEDQFNDLFFEGEIANSPENAAVVLFVEEDGSIIDYKTYSTKDAKHWRLNATQMFITLEDYKKSFNDEFATFDYLKVIPFGSDAGMFLHDPYVNPDKRMTNFEVAKLMEETVGRQEETLRDENERVVCTFGSSVCTGDIFFQWGWVWQSHHTCNNGGVGASAYGHNSIVDQGCQLNPRLRDFHIRESWYAGMKEGNGNTVNGGVRHVRAGTTWGWTSDMLCTNYWHNTRLNGATIGNINSFYAQEHGKPYKWHTKVPGAGRPTQYYCSLYVWEVYEEMVGLDLDADGGPVVTPWDIARGILNNSQFANPGNYTFELCDF